MLTKATIVERLKSALPGFPIKRAWLFGSCATGDNTPDSDIDLLVDYDKDEHFSLFTIGAVVSGLSKLLGVQVDVVEAGHVLLFAQRHVDDTKILIYERDA